MMLEPKPVPSSYKVEGLARHAARISCGFLVFLMILTTVDVVSRYILNAPVYGGLELSETALLALIMLALPFVAATNGHVRVDVLDSVFGALGRRISDIVTSVVSLAVLYFLAQRSVYKALDAAEFGDVTNFLQIPLWPQCALIAFSAVGIAIVLVAQIIQLLRGR